MTDMVTFHWADYLVFSVVLLASALIGVYYGCTGKKQSTSDEFLLGDRQMPLFPVSMSMVATFFSAVSVLGAPSEIYNYGTLYWLWVISFWIALPITAHVYLPIYYDLKLTSAYEYLDRRFNKVIRIMGIITYTFHILIYMSVILYGPSVAFELVSKLPYWATVLLGGFVCLFYTSFGGMKAVLWADTLQVAVILIGILALIIQGCINLGGVGEAFRIANENRRIEFFNWNPDPTERHTTLTVIIGGTFTVLVIYAGNQQMIQRYLTVDTKRRAQIAVYANMPLTFIAQSLFCLTGVVLFAAYATCDPLTQEQIKNRDQMVTYMVMDILGHLKGMGGLFMASVFAAAMSTMSSGQNALAAVYLEDVAKPIYESVHKRPMPAKFAVGLSKAFAVFFGIATMALAFVIDQLGGEILTLALKIFGIIGGPLLGLFTLGILFPCANAWGAGAGLIASLAIEFWINLGFILNGLTTPTLPTRTDGCPNATFTSNATFTTMVSTTTTMVYETTQAVEPTEEPAIFYMYKISYMWFTVIALLVTFIVGLPVSWIAAKITGRYKTEDVDPCLVWPICDKICCCLPEMFRGCCRVPERKSTQNDNRGSYSKVYKMEMNPPIHRMEN
ncbi:unnamed protein product [Owenia fusiformis]|uniref:Sodium-coupled monocarboxylate transporter 1 n=1 Tax=Owenia fusiformis TaxID=6347 RepID=A0A8S4PXS9_OWEFU|nr:unnamed protein product [Owenia fusiformis]